MREIYRKIVDDITALGSKIDNTKHLVLAEIDDLKECHSKIKYDICTSDNNAYLLDEFVEDLANLLQIMMNIASKSGNTSGYDLVDYKNRLDHRKSVTIDANATINTLLDYEVTQMESVIRKYAVAEIRGSKLRKLLENHIPLKERTKLLEDCRSFYINKDKIIIELTELYHQEKAKLQGIQQEKSSDESCESIDQNNYTLINESETTKEFRMLKVDEIIPFIEKKKIDNIDDDKIKAILKDILGNCGTKDIKNVIKEKGKRDKKCNTIMIRSKIEKLLIAYHQALNKH